MLKALAFILTFTLITLSLIFSGGATAVPLIGFWFAGMNKLLGCLLAGLCLTGVLFISYKIFDLFGKTLVKLYNWLTSPASTSSPKILTEHDLCIHEEMKKLNDPSKLHDPSIYMPALFTSHNKACSTQAAISNHSPATSTQTPHHSASSTPTRAHT